jgi:Transposase DDE domain group 1
MTWCEANRVDYLFGLARNQRLVGAIDAELAWAEEDSFATGKPARHVADFMWTTRASWSRRRRVVARGRAASRRSGREVKPIPASWSPP